MMKLIVLLAFVALTCANYGSTAETNAPAEASVIVSEVPPATCEGEAVRSCAKKCKAHCNNGVGNGPDCRPGRARYSNDDHGGVPGSPGARGGGAAGTKYTTSEKGNNNIENGDLAFLGSLDGVFKKSKCHDDCEDAEFAKCKAPVASLPPATAAPQECVLPVGGNEKDCEKRSFDFCGPEVTSAFTTCRQVFTKFCVKPEPVTDAESCLRARCDTLPKDQWHSAAEKSAACRKGDGRGGVSQQCQEQICQKYTTKAPETTTKAVVYTTKGASVPTTTKARETTTKAPTTTTKAPTTTTKAPETTTTKAPETTTKAPETTTKAPETTTQAPTQRPVVPVCNDCASFESLEDIIVTITGELKGAMADFAKIGAAPCGRTTVPSSTTLSPGSTNAPGSTNPVDPTIAVVTASTTSAAATTTTPVVAAQQVSGSFREQELDVAEYRRMCNANPADRFSCDPNFRNMVLDDRAARREAEALGIKLVEVAKVETEGHADYAVPKDLFKKLESGLQKQLRVKKQELEAGAAAKAAELAAKAAGDAQADAAALEAEKKAKAAGKTDAEIAAEKEKARQDEIARQEAARLEAERVRIANAPKVKRVGRFLKSPDGRNLYFNKLEKAEGPTVICVEQCRQFWPVASATWIADESAGGVAATSVIIRPDGDQQLAINGRVLYTFRDDRANSDDTKGVGLPNFELA